MRTKPTQKEIGDLLNDAEDQIEEGGSKFPGMSYEEGLMEGIMWVLGMIEDNPYSEDN